MVEVDASEVGVGAVSFPALLLGRQDAPLRVFSHRLSSAERNYDIGNRELLAVKLALEEWRIGWRVRGYPLLSGLTIRTLSISDPLNVLTPGRLGGHCFSVVLSFRCPTVRVPRTSKPDALSRIFDQSERLSTPECIIPERLVVSTLTWEVESKVRTALEGVTPPPGCPPSRLFCAGEIEVRRYSVGSLLQCGVSSRSESYQFFGQTAILVEFHGS